ncbi:helix-turn-helix transcriptional regulator [Haloarchaeobius sp. HRN-SO-5]|uniref:helix-turn-helix transcriptional regulator n=1 Tax=Haloarchaeobius sp. HRN-SO-5 TaxID=3446118 RepID=UPI003EB90CAC
MDPDTAAFLAGSDDRLALLTYLTDRSAAPATISDDLSLPRRSVQRHLSQFVDRGWATRDDGAYGLTTLGELVAAEHASYLETLSRLDEFGQLYRHLPDREHAPDPRLLEDADVVVASDADPQAPMHHYLTAMREFESDRIRMLSPVLSRLFHDAHADLAIEGAHTELVMTDDLVDRARELNPVEFDVVVSVDVLDLYRHPGPIDFGMTLGENRVLLSAYADGQLTACVDSTNPDLVTWAGDLFERYREEAAEMEPTISLPFSLRNR